MGSKKLAIRSRNLLHGHNTARLLPDSYPPGFHPDQRADSGLPSQLPPGYDPFPDNEEVLWNNILSDWKLLFYCLHRLTAFLLITL